jgi:hypothetical protein
LLIFRYPINAYLLGQFIPFLLACIILTWWGITTKNTVLTLLGLIGLLVRPEVVIIPIIVLLLHNYVEGNRKVLMVWIGALIFLWLLSRIFIGPWVIDFLEGILSYTGYSFTVWPPLGFGNIWLGVLIALFVLAWGGWMLWGMHNLPSQDRLPWEISVSVLLSLIVFPQTNNYTLILGLIAIWVTLWASGSNPIVWLLLLLVLASPWLFYVMRSSLQPGIEQLLIPLLIGVILTHQWLLWARKLRVKTELK